MYGLAIIEREGVNAQDCYSCGHGFGLCATNCFLLYNVWSQGVSSVSRFPTDINLRDAGTRNRNSRKIPNNFSVMGLY